MIDNFATLHWFLTAIAVPLFVYAFKEMHQMKADFHKFQLFCANNYADNKQVDRILEQIREVKIEIKKDFADLKKELKEPTG